MTAFENFVKLNGKDILLAFCAKFKKSKTCVFTEMCNFGEILLVKLILLARFCGPKKL